MVPGNANGSLDGIALKALTVAFHEPGFIATLQAENQQPFWFMMSAAQRQRAGNPMGPVNPQALNRYAYVQNNPLRWTDPGGHVGLTTYDIGPIPGTLRLTHAEALPCGTSSTQALLNDFEPSSARSLKGAVDTFTCATLAASSGGSTHTVAMLWGLSVVGLTAAETLTILGRTGGHCALHSRQYLSILLIMNGCSEKERRG